MLFVFCFILAIGSNNKAHSVHFTICCQVGYPGLYHGKTIKFFWQPQIMTGPALLQWCFPVGHGRNPEGPFKHLCHIAGTIKPGFLCDLRQGELRCPQVFSHFPQPEIHQVAYRASAHIFMKDPVAKGLADVPALADILQRDGERMNRI